MIKNLLLYVLVLLSFCAVASVPKKSTEGNFSLPGGGSDTKYASASAACAAYLDGKYGPAIRSDYTFSVERMTGGTGWVTYKCNLFNQGNPWGYVTTDGTTADSCPENSQEKDGVCNCSAGYAENVPAPGQAPSYCVKSDKCPAIKGLSMYVSIPGRAMPGSSSCGANGCLMTMSNFVMMIKEKSTGKWTSQGDASFTGEACDPDPSTSASETACKGVEGTVNGVKVCAPPSNQNVVESVKQSSSSSTTSTPSESPSSSPSSSTTSSTTTSSTVCDSGNCSTTTTVTSSKPNEQPSTTTSSTEESSKSFCKENPDSPMCKSGSFSGACSSGFTCDGDAIQCAMAQEQYKRNCQLYDPDTDPASAVNKALAGDDPGNVDKMKAAAHDSPIKLQGFDFSGRGWSRTCPDDPSFSLSWAHGSATEWKLPFSKLCTPLGLAADVAVAITALGCVVFVLRGGSES